MAAAPDPAALARLEQVLEQVGTVRRELTRHGITIRQFRALRELAQGPLRLGRLAEQIEIRPPSCVTLVDALTEAGLVARVDDPADARASLVELTASGRRRLDAATREAAASLAGAGERG